MKTKISNFTPLFDSMIKSHGLVTAAVFGRINRYSWKYGYCTASIATIAKELGISGETVRKHIKVLIKDEYLVDATPELKNRPHRYSPTDKAQFEIVLRAVDKGAEEKPEVDVTPKQVDSTTNLVEGATNEVVSAPKQVDTNRQVINKPDNSNVELTLEEQIQKKKKLNEDMVGKWERMCISQGWNNFFTESIPLELKKKVLTVVVQDDYARNFMQARVGIPGIRKTISGTFGDFDLQIKLVTLDEL
jgi:DNA-binding MarR family transcriptional regulator